MFGPGSGAILDFSVLQLQVHLQERAAAGLKRSSGKKPKTNKHVNLLLKAKETDKRQEKEKEDGVQGGNSFIVHLGEGKGKRRNKVLQIRGAAAKGKILRAEGSFTRCSDH